jgi:DNA-binding YbaB/EbfC family protein
MADTMTMRSGAMRPGGQPNMQQIMKQAQKMQEQVAKAQAELAEAELTGTAGGGLVTVVVTGLGEFKSVKIDPKAVDPDDIETLEDLVLAAIHNAAEEQRELTEQKMGPATGGMSLPGF